MPEFAHGGLAANTLLSMTGVDSIARELEKCPGWHTEIERLLRPTLAIQRQIEHIKNSLSALYYARDNLAANSIAKLLEQQKEGWPEFVKNPQKV